MTVDFFIKQLPMNKDKEKYFDEKIMNPKYVPYEEKTAKCENIIRSTSVVKDETTGVEIYKRNTPACNLFFNLTLIDLYTNIDIDFTHALKDYNALEERGCIDEFLKRIPKTEYVLWQKMIDMVANDYMENERSIVSFFETKLGAVDKTAESIAEVFKNIEQEVNK